MGRLGLAILLMFPGHGHYVGHTLSVYGDFALGRKPCAPAGRAIPDIDRLKNLSFCVHTLPYPLVTLTHIFLIN